MRLLLLLLPLLIHSFARKPAAKIGLLLLWVFRGSGMLLKIAPTFWFISVKTGDLPYPTPQRITLAADHLFTPKHHIFEQLQRSQL
ncbi:hypothetical protein B0T24DRAFT_422864 [Lasiosphaeria ovina]|uniref:Secreted protein n=1 Tax=Lasiosphaeria ovina TaxID=92902 RepID=A0AAE0JW71_9PEZI|nr:hypothetical protein B0T24DRAFT_422864 [Lasiosphaeria ovina]